MSNIIKLSIVLLQTHIFHMVQSRTYLIMFDRREISQAYYSDHLALHNLTLCWLISSVATLKNAYAWLQDWYANPPYTTQEIILYISLFFYLSLLLFLFYFLTCIVTDTCHLLAMVSGALLMGHSLNSTQCFDVQIVH